MLSTDHNFIFIHIPKTAGSSISAALRSLPKVRYSRLREVCLYPRGVRAWRVSQHDKAAAIRERIGEKQFGRFFKFGFVRNPWDLMVSSYHWWLQKTNRFDVFRSDLEEIRGFEGFDGFIRSRFGANMLNEFSGTMLDWVADDRGRIIVDYIGKVENIDQGWRVVLESIGVEFLPLPSENRTERRPYRDYYTEETRDLVRWRFQREIGLFDYEF